LVTELSALSGVDKDVLSKEARMASTRNSSPVHTLLTLGVCAIGAASLLGACASTPRRVATTKKIRRLKLEPIKVIASAGGKRIEVLDATGLFEAGGRHLSAKKHREALRHYDRLLVHYPKTRFTAPALYNAGLAHEALYEYDKATKRYRALIAAYGKTRDAVDAGFRLGGCLAELHRWKDSAKVFAQLTTRTKLSAGDRIEAFARKGLAEFRQHDHDAARKTLIAAVAFARKVDGVERLDNDFFLGMSYYYLAAIPHVHFRLSKVDSGKKMGKTLDAKAKLLLVSQRRYIEAIRVKNPYWATAAGFQIGSLYKEFYGTLMTALPNFKKAARKNAKRAKISIAQAEKQLVKVYLEELHKKVKPLLKKAIRVFEKNVVMGTRVGIRSRWLAKSRHQIRELKRLLLAKPADVLRLLPKKAKLPEDQPGAPASSPAKPTQVAPTGSPAGSTPSSVPATKTPKPPAKPQPGRRVLL
jgi:tetratricopeptide (TPR) repeat protein